MFDNLKVKLIHKWGGLLPADIPAPPKKKEVHIIDVHASCEFTNRMGDDGKEEFEKWQADMLARGIAKQILAQGLVTYKKSRGRLTICSCPDDYCLTATAYLIRESDAKIENCDSLNLNRTISVDEAYRQLGMRGGEYHE